VRAKSIRNGRSEEVEGRYWGRGKGGKRRRGGKGGLGVDPTKFGRKSTP